MNPLVCVQYEIEGLEGLCNQLMAVFGAVGEALYYAGPNQSVCLLFDVQTRNSIDFDVQPYFSSIRIDSYVDVDTDEPAGSEKYLRRRARDHASDTQCQIIRCRRYPQRVMSPDESRDAGVLLATSFPFAARVSKLANDILGRLSRYPRWKAIHLRIEKDVLHLPSVQSTGLEVYTNTMLQQTADSLASTPNLSAAFIASGVRDEEYGHVVNALRDEFPHLEITRKQEVLRENPDLLQEFQTLCLEEQALVDWLVCLGAPLFAGQHASSYAYLVGYMRYYRDFEKESTYLCPEYQPCWDVWFPRV